MNPEYNSCNPEERVIFSHRIHYEWINKAILADESNDFEDAIQFYIKGIEMANMCLRENVVGNSHIQVRAKGIQEKMKNNKESEIERLEYLIENVLKSEKDTRVHKKSSSLDFDEVDSIAQSVTNSICDKKIKPVPNSGKLRKDCCSKDNDPRIRSHNEIYSKTKPATTGENLTNAIKTISTRAKVPKVTTAISKRPEPVSGGQPKPKLPNTSSPLNRKVDKDAIWSKLKNIDKAAVETILNEVLDSKVIKFDDIAGNDGAKQCLLETVIYPKLRPELFTGLRSPAKGILLFGPPGNGKTLLAKAVANESGCVFYNISAASLMSKWVGEGEKMVRALFAVARLTAPSVIFLDEVDSLLSARNSDDKSVSRRMLTQFLQEIDGAATDSDDKLLVMAATNRPFELDDAALRRFQKKIHIKMPEPATRKVLLLKLLSTQAHKLSNKEIDQIIDLTKGYSSSDLANLAKSAAMAPIRELSFEQLRAVTVDSMRKLIYNDFILALRQIKPSVPPQSLAKFDNWNSEFGDNS